jgi:hypothetical protein
MSMVMYQVAEVGTNIDLLTNRADYTYIPIQR